MTVASAMPASVVTLPAGGQLPATASSAASATLNQNDFLQLLTTQLEKQDPLNPTNPSDLAAELAQFTTATGVQTLNQTASAAAGLQAAGLVGQNVAVPGNALVLGANGAPGMFSLAGAATDVAVTITNAGGVVAQLDLGAMGAGNQTFAWNGQTADGTALPSGTYGYSVTAAGTGGASVAATPFSVVPVTAVSLNGQNGPLLDLGGGLSPVGLSAVQQIF